MRTKTDNVERVGKHAFELAGLGLAPFRFTGLGENVITYSDGSQKPGGSCDYCATGIRIECHVRSADGKNFKVGCNCIERVGDTGLMKAYKSSPEFRAHQARLRKDKANGVQAKLDALMARSTELATLPHPYGFNDRNTGKPLSALDWAKWMLDRCGASGKARLLKRLEEMLHSLQ